MCLAILIINLIFIYIKSGTKYKCTKARAVSDEIDKQQFGKIPSKNMQPVKLIKMTDSSSPKSCFELKYKGKGPKAILLYKKSEYVALKMTLKPARIAAVGYTRKTPIKIKNSPIKLAVPGKPIFAALKMKNSAQNLGFKEAKPP